MLRQQIILALALTAGIAHAATINGITASDPTNMTGYMDFHTSEIPGGLKIYGNGQPDCVQGGNCTLTFSIQAGNANASQIRFDYEFTIKPGDGLEGPTWSIRDGQSNLLLGGFGEDSYKGSALLPTGTWTFHAEGLNDFTLIIPTTSWDLTNPGGGSTTAAPEPSTFALAGAGFVWLAWRRKKN